MVEAWSLRDMSRLRGQLQAIALLIDGVSGCMNNIWFPFFLLFLVVYPLWR